MNAKQEAEKFLDSSPETSMAVELSISISHIGSLIDELEATERKLAEAEKDAELRELHVQYLAQKVDEAEKVVEAANLNIEILKSTGAYTKDKIFNVMTRLEKTLSDYEASKE